MLRKVATMVFVATFAVACGGSDSKDKDKEPQAGSDCEASEQRCDGADLQTCVNGNWTTQTTCPNGCSQGSLPGGKTTATCADPSNDWEGCESDAQCSGASICFDMTPLDMGFQASRCVTACTNDDECSTGETCIGLTNTNGACVTADAAGYGETCGFNGKWCNEGLDCVFERNGAAACYQSCPKEEANLGQGSCNAGQECLTDGTLIYELDGSGERMTCTEDTECTQNANGQCLDDGSGTTYCIIESSYCAEGAALGEACRTFGLEAGNTPALCRSSTDPTVTATPVCTSYGIVDWQVDDSGNKVACANESEMNCDLSTGSLCLEVPGAPDPAIACWVFLRQCQAFCQSTLEDPDLVCPTGYECVDPTRPASYFIEEDSSGERVACPGGDTDCDTAGGFTCISFTIGDYCGKPVKMCEPVSSGT